MLGTEVVNLDEGTHYHRSSSLRTEVGNDTEGTHLK